jgi:hypothetical protein
MAHSELADAVARLRRSPEETPEPPSRRPLSPEEIARLESLGNTSEDWSRVRVGDGFDCDRVRQSRFQGDVRLGAFAGKGRLAEGIEVPTGVYRSTLVDCDLGDDALVWDVHLLANYVVGEGAVLADCGSIVCEGETVFGNGLALPLGIESGGRDIPVYAEITVEVAAALTRGPERRAALEGYGRAVADYLARVRCSRGVIERGAAVRSTPKLRNTYLGPYARVEGATLVADSTLLSNQGEPAQILSGACVTESVLQWGSCAKTLAVVKRSVLTEHAEVERHGTVTDSLVGPNTALGGGEVTASLLGPFVGFHHQALLIAALWPEGRGNVGYGANVGSNHTSKAPDQEFWPGEGTFLGLGVNIKYPSDFSKSPYSIIASGVTTLPQKLAFPFALVNTPSARWRGVSPAYNELIPAWGLTDNLFALMRNEGKFQARNEARRSRTDFRVFRPETVDLMLDACRRLESVARVRKVYTDQEIEGLGKNYLLEDARLRALGAYRFFATYYALVGLLERAGAVLRAAGPAAARRILETESTDPRWEHQRRLLGDLGVRDVGAGLDQLPPLLEKVAREVERSKAKDDERGARIIDDYKEVHAPAGDDPVVRRTWARARELQAEAEYLLARLAPARLHRGTLRTGT